MFATLVISLLVSQTATINPVEPVLTPEQRLDTPWWKDRHDKCVALTQAGGHELIFVGDSITHGWETRGKAIWDKYYAPRKAANFGFSGDRCEHVLWRMQNGEIIGLQPKVAVVMIGTNSISASNANTETTTLGVKTVVESLREAMPKTKILLLAIFPRGQSATDQIRKNVTQTNEKIALFADNKNVFFLDVGKYYLSRSGEMWNNLMPDLLHPSDAGYEIWAKAMEPKLAELLGEK